MEAIGSIAAISQILGQVIDMWQQVDLARESVRTRSKLLADISAQLSQSLSTMREAERQLILCTPIVQDQLKVIESTTNELQQIIEEMELLQKKSILQQYLLALGHRAKDEAKLKGIFNRLENAKTELGLRMHVAHAGATGEIAQGMKSLVESQRTQPETSGYVLVEGNESYEEADQRNGIIGISASRTPNMAQIRDNTARGKSRQQNLIAGGCSSLSLLRMLE